MKKLALSMLAVVGACEGTPLAPDRQPALKVSSIVTVSARSQDATLEFSSGETAQASFKARFYASTSPDPTAQMDGAILVVSAVDGPMPQIGGESLAIEISRHHQSRGRGVARGHRDREHRAGGGESISDHWFGPTHSG